MMIINAAATTLKSLSGIVTLFGNLIKIQKVSSHQLIFKSNDLVLLLKAI